MRFNDLKTFITEGLLAKYGADYVLPEILPGPNTNPQTRHGIPGPIIYAQLGAGAGLTTEHHFDRPFINIRTIGPSGDFETAEALAWDVDEIMNATDGNGTVGTADVLYVVRFGAAPQLVDFDNAERYHFQCNYVTETQTGF